MAIGELEVSAQQGVPVSLVDADVHPYLRAEAELREYIDPAWRGRSLKFERPGYQPPNAGRRRDSWPPNGLPSGSDPEFVSQQVLEHDGVDYAILIDQLVGSHPDPAFDVAVHTAVNAWLADTWLTRYNAHGRFKGSITLPVSSPEAAVREIEHWSGHKHFVQVRVPQVVNGRAYGHPQFHRIWEAASRHGLPVAMHTSGGGGMLPLSTPLGFVEYFLELHSVAYPLWYVSQFTSLICEGVFDSYPDLRWVFVEGGVSWVAPLLWHLEKNWSDVRLQSETRLKRRPKDYLRDNIRFTTQPMEEPEPRHLVCLLEMVEADHVLMFASDYPHWDYDDPRKSIPPMSPAARERIMFRNAVELYGLPAVRPGTEA